MFVRRRAVAALPQLVSRRVASHPRCGRPYASSAAASASRSVADAAEPLSPPPAASKASVAPSTSTAARTRSAKAAATAARASALPADLVFEAKTASHQAPAEASQAEKVPVIDWANSFYGISAKRVTEEQAKALMEPIDVNDIEVKPDGIIYLPEIKYRKRLIEVFGPMGWGIIPKGDPVVTNNIVTREYALIADGRFVSQAQGENAFFSAEQLPSAVEGCKSNALMRCCKDLGISSQLWDPHFIRDFKKKHMEEVWVEHVTTKKRRLFWYKKGHVEVAYPFRRSQ